jgi:sentrin-specific protease 8
MDDKLLSYGDCLLRVRDVALLTGPHWLNDAVMSFFFEYLRSEGAQPDEPHADRVVLVDASLSFLVANVSPNEARAVLTPLGVSRAHMALFLVRRARPRFERFSTSFDVNVRNLSDLRPTRDPGPGTRFRSAQVNDNDDVSVAGGGSHWSLLAYLRDENAFAHFDSAGGRNDAAAARLAKTLADALMDEKKKSPAVTFASGRSGAPRQTNGYDCGVFALATARAARRLVAREGAGGATASRLAACVAREVTQSAAAEFRGELLRTIRALAEERNR